MLTSPAQTGAVTLALPQDVQIGSVGLSRRRCSRNACGTSRVPSRSAPCWRAPSTMIRSAKRPLIVAGGGVLYSEASEALAQFAAQTGIPVGETQAGKGSLPFDHPQNLGAIGVTGTPGANIAAREADLVIAIGTRLSDFTTASKTAFQNPDVRFININVAEFDAYKHGGLPLYRGRTRRAGTDWRPRWPATRSTRHTRTASRQWKERWEQETDRIYGSAARSADQPGRSRRRGHQSSVASAGRRGVRGRQPARRSAQTVAHAPAERVPPGVRLLVHGLRDRRRARREDGRSVARCVRDGRRRLVPDDVVGDRDVDSGRLQAQHHHARQSRIFEHRRTVAVHRVAAASAPTTARRTRTGQLDGEHVPVDFAALCAGLGARTVRARTREDLESAQWRRCATTLARPRW